MKIKSFKKNIDLEKTIKNLPPQDILFKIRYRKTFI